MDHLPTAVADVPGRTSAEILRDSRARASASAAKAANGHRKPEATAIRSGRARGSGGMPRCR